ncbi:helix-turn-helix domain-containing protein [Niveispirillum irakense]|uniref:helix-turn-helix domain-containing protein n=1 Tax=Niveispirillum irakense TaxID=34011 RepID=UPI00040CE243|nr:helix-turn-helix domain-containing protein [Niveispirillum irakense]
MEKVKPVRAMLRVLDVLQVLSSRYGGTISDVSNAIDLPRTTTYRVLETLCSAGYVTRDGAGERYRLTVLVRSLSDGYDDEAWIGEVAQPILADLGRKMIWPVSISTNRSHMMLVRCNTDKQSPLALERYNAGVQVSILRSASGRAFLAFSPPPQRSALLDIALGLGADMEGAGRQRDLIEKTLEGVRAGGYAIALRQYRGESAAAVPIFSGTHLLGCLGMRFMDKAVNESTFVVQSLPIMREAAHAIGEAHKEWKQSNALELPVDRWDWTLERRVEH